jgi:hypothetical protein
MVVNMNLGKLIDRNLVVVVVVADFPSYLGYIHHKLHFGTIEQFVIKM